MLYFCLAVRGRRGSGGAGAGGSSLPSGPPLWAAASFPSSQPIPKPCLYWLSLDIYMVCLTLFHTLFTIRTSTLSPSCFGRKTAINQVPKCEIGKRTEKKNVLIQHLTILTFNNLNKQIQKNAVNPIEKVEGGVVLVTV